MFTVAASLSPLAKEFSHLSLRWNCSEWSHKSFKGKTCPPLSPAALLWLVMEGCTDAITLSDLIADQESIVYMTGGVFGDANTHAGSFCYLQQPREWHKVSIILCVQRPTHKSSLTTFISALHGEKWPITSPLKYLWFKGFTKRNKRLVNTHFSLDGSFPRSLLTTSLSF